MNSQRTRLLLTLVALLAVARFALVPLLQWQQETQAGNQELAERNARATQLLADNERSRRLEQLSKQLEQARLRISQTPSDLALQVEINQVLDSTLAKHALEETSRAWNVIDQSPRLADIRIGIRGHFYDLIEWLDTLEKAPHYLQAVELDLRRVARQNTGMVTASIRLQRHFTLTEPQETP